MSKKSDFLSKKIWHCQRDSYKENVNKCIQPPRHYVTLPLTGEKNVISSFAPC